MPKSFIPQKLLFSVGGLAIAALVLLGLWKIPQWQVERIQQQIEALNAQPKAANPQTIASLEKSKLDAENAARTVLVQAIGGLLVFATGYIGYLNYKTTQEKLVAERFSKAVEQLGSENIHVRLGGIYALEQIAKDAEEKYYWQVMETLTSYVRVRSPWNPNKTEKPKSFVQAAIELHHSRLETSFDTLAVDIQAVMTVLARRKHKYKHKLEPHRLDLRKVDISLVQLNPNANLCGIDFSGANLTRAILYRANLQDAQFWNASLHQALLQEANLQQASFLEADLFQVTLLKANLQGAFLGRANLAKALLGGRLGPESAGANCERANFWEASLEGAKLEYVNFKKASLTRTNLADVIGLTWEQLNKAESFTKELLPNYLLQQLQPKKEKKSHSLTQGSADSQSSKDGEESC